MYAATDVGGVYKTVDGGRSWSPANSGLGDLEIQALAGPRSLSGTDVVYAGTRRSGVYLTTNGGATWQERNRGLWNRQTWSLAVDPWTSCFVAYVGTVAGLFRTTDGGENWQWCSAPISLVQSLAIDPENPQTVYAGLQSIGVYRSKNGGINWQNISAGLTNLNIGALLVDRSAGCSKVYAGTGDGVWSRTIE